MIPAAAKVPEIRLEGISKRFGDNVALDGVTIDLRSGEVTALLGENGAGKSTLMKVLYGYYAADSGRMMVDGAEVKDSIAATGAGPRNLHGACRVRAWLRNFQSTKTDDVRSARTRPAEDGPSAQRS